MGEKEVHIDDLGREVEESRTEVLYKHPSYGMLGIYRTQGTDRTLFGSSIKHSNTIKIELKTGVHSRHLNSDTYYGDKILFEVELSNSQFAELITNMNVGSGVPVTIRRTQENMKIGKCPFENKADVHLKEFKENLKDNYKIAQDLIKRAENCLNEKTLKKKDREDLICILHKLSMELSVNMSYQYSQFEEQVEKTTLEAKGEIEAFFQNRLSNLANNALSEKFAEELGSPIKLTEREEEKG